MRVISQDGFIEVTYENTVIVLDTGEECTAIKAFDSISSDEFVVMGVYETAEKAETVLKMVRDKYAQYLSTDGGALATVDFYIQPNVWNIPKVFQFPQDEEVNA